MGVDYIAEESRAVAIHEAGHAVASHVYMHDVALHAPVDPQARRLARPPPGDREGGALLELAPRGGRQPRVDARRDGRRARLLRRELHRRRRRRPERHRARRAHGRHVRHGPGADRPRAGASPSERRARGVEKDAHGALRAHRPADHEPRAAGSAMDADPIGAVLGDPAKRTAAAQILGQAYVTAVCLHPRTTARPVAAHRRRARPAQGALRRRGGRAARGGRARSAPAIDVLDESIWPKV